MKQTKFIIFGASGDLARRYIYPALFDLYQQGIQFNEYLGYGRTEFTDEEFQAVIKKSITEKKGTTQEKTEFVKNFRYIPGTYGTQGLEKLKPEITGFKPIYYLSLPTRYELVKDILEGLADHSMIHTDSKIVFEKPFGSDYKSAKKLNDLILKHFREDQVYRIDHYLAKGLVRDLITLRFANSIFEPLWNNKFISDILIQIKEELPVMDRGEYYDETGAIRDMLQNHALQLLAIAAMEKPEDFDSKAIHKQKLAVLKKVCLYENKPEENIEIGQYKNYINEEHIPKDSLTETYAALKVEVNTPKWKKVPITLMTGKMLDEKTIDIIINFKFPENHPWTNKKCQLEKNELHVNIQPKNEVHLKLNFGFDSDALCSKPIELRFGFDNQFLFKEAYENALMDLYNSDQSLFPSSEEILASWKFIDGVMKTIEKDRKKMLKFY